jgi:hypothetical protein
MKAPKHCTLKNGRIYFQPPRDMREFFRAGPLGRDGQKGRALAKRLAREIEKKRKDLGAKTPKSRAAVMDVATSVRMITSDDFIAFSEAYSSRFGNISEDVSRMTGRRYSETIPRSPPRHWPRGTPFIPNGAIMSGAEVDW